MVPRESAARGETVRLRIEFTVGGVLVDPSHVREVQILDASHAVLATFAAAAILRDDVGQYHVDWPISVTESLTVHHDRWFATAVVGATEEQFTLDFLVLRAVSAISPTAYVSTEDARAYLVEGTNLTDAEIDTLVERASEIVETCTGQSFLLRTETRTFDGPGQPMLNVRRPIRSVTRIVCLGSPPGNGDIELDLSDIRIGGSGTTLACGNIVPRPYRGMRLHVSPHLGGGGNGWWPHGFQNIQVTGEWGAYDTPPPAIKHAVGLLVRYMGECDDPHGSEAAFESERISGDRDYTIRKVWTNVTQNATTGYSDVDVILARYMAPPVVVGVI